MTAPQGPLAGGEKAKTEVYPEPAVDLPTSPKEGSEGLPIEQYAERYLLSESEIWRRIRRGELLGRTQAGRLYIYPGASLNLSPFGLPPLPEARAGATQDASPGYLSLSGERGATPELALLLDHLSLAKEENREILRLTQESLRQVSQMADSLVQMKDAVISAKDSELGSLRQTRELEVAALRQELATRDQEISRLKQHSEDLEMLARSMVQQARDHG